MMMEVTFYQAETATHIQNNTYSNNMNNKNLPDYTQKTCAKDHLEFGE